MKRILGIGMLILLCFSCTDKVEKYAELNDLEIQDYLADNNLEATKTESGLYYIIYETGNSQHPDIYSTIKVNFKGYLIDGTVVETTNGEWASFLLYGMMSGWQEAVPMLGVGGRGTFFLPSKLGFGGQEKSKIPPYSVLIYEIELLDFH